MLKVKQIVLFTFQVILLTACNSGNNSSIQKHASLPKSQTTNLTEAPFNPTDGVGYNTTDNVRALNSCYNMSHNPEPNYDPNTNPTPTPENPTYYASRPTASSFDFYYLDNVGHISEMFNLAENFSMSASSEFPLGTFINPDIKVGSNLQLAVDLNSKIAKNFDYHSTNVYGIGSVAATAGWNLPDFADIHKFSSALTIIGKEKLAQARKLGGDAGYQFFVSACGDSVVDSWEYREFASAHFMFSNSKKNLNIYTMSRLTTASEYKAGGNEFKIKNITELTNDFKSSDSTTNVEYHADGIGNSFIPQSISSSCNFYGGGAGDCSNVFSGFAQDFATWAQDANAMTYGTDLPDPPKPGINVSGYWDGKFTTRSLKNYIIKAIGNKPSGDYNSDYSIYINKIRSMVNTAGLAKSAITLFKMDPSVVSNDVTTNEMNSINNRLTTFMTDLNGTPSLDSVNQQIHTFCLSNESQTTNSPECISELKKIVDKLEDTYPYAEILHLQEQYGNVYSVVHFMPSSTTNENLNVPDQMYTYYLINPSNHAEASPNSLYVGNLQTISIESNAITSGALYVNSYGNAVMNGRDDQGNIVNLYLGQGTHHGLLSGETSSTLLSELNTLQTPFQKDYYQYGYALFHNMNIDGHYLAGNQYLYENLNFMPGNYIFVQSGGGDGKPYAYLLIAANDLTLHEYAVMSPNYSPDSLHEIWTNANASRDTPIESAQFRTSSGLWGSFSDAPEAVQSEALDYKAIIDSSGGKVPPDTDNRAFALHLSTDGDLSVYKANLNGQGINPIWSNHASSAKILSDVTYPDVPPDSLWYEPKTKTNN